MYTINQSFNVAPEILGAWQLWIKNTYIPHVMESGFFENYKILKLITTIEDYENTYAIQFFTKNAHQIDEIIQLFELDFEFSIATKFGEKALFFRSLLHEIVL